MINLSEVRLNRISLDNDIGQISLYILVEVIVHSWYSSMYLPTSTEEESTLLNRSHRPPNPIQPKTSNKTMQHCSQRCKMHFHETYGRKMGILTGENSRDLWNAVKLTSLGNSTNCTTIQSMSLRLPNGITAKNDRENMSVIQPHCKKLFNNHKKSISPIVLIHIRQRDCMLELDEPISSNRIRIARANGTPAEAFKALNTRNRDHIHTIIKGFWDGTHDYLDWHIRTCIPIPKTTRLDNPNSTSWMSAPKSSAKSLLPDHTKFWKNREPTTNLGQQETEDTKTENSR